MNQYIATLDGIQLGQINDMADNHTIVMDTLNIWLRAGAAVQLKQNGAPATLKLIDPKPAAPKPAPKKAPKAPSKAAKTEWRQGATVYLCWSQLPLDPKTHLSAYRHAKGIVETFRGGPGVTKTVGVRFGGDPELTWLRPTELTATPEVDL